MLSFITQVTFGLRKYLWPNILKLANSYYDYLSIFVRATILDISTVLELTLVLERDHEYITWSTFDDNIAFYDRMFFDSKIYGDFSVSCEFKPNH